MGFGGSVAAMISSIKYNKRPKRKTYFDKTKGSFSKTTKRKKFSQKKLSDDERARLIFKLNEQKRKQRIKVLFIVLISIVLTILVGIILELMFFDIAKEFLN